MARERWTGAAEPQDRIRSIYAARSGASGASSAVDFTRMKLADPAQSLRMAYLSHLTPAKAETPRESGRSQRQRASQSLPRAYRRWHRLALSAAARLYR